MKRRILVRVSPAGDLSIEAEGFRGKGCESATKAIEDALGVRKERHLKPQYCQPPLETRNIQRLEGGNHP